MKRRRPDRPVKNNPPSFEARRPLELAEHPPDAELMRQHIRPNVNSYLRCYTLGECTVLVTRELDRWHLSIRHHARYPTWDEIAEARYRLLPKTKTIAMILPPRSEYINVDPNVFQLVEIDPIPDMPFPEELRTDGRP